MVRRTWLGLVGLVVGLCSGTAPSLAQNCPRWLVGEGIPGCNNTVKALCPWNDGSGLKLAVAGDFTVAGAATVARVASWDGSAWQALGGGVNGSVNAALQFGTSLVIAGDFTLTDGQNIQKLAQWNGSAWSGLGATLGGAFVRPNALAVYNNELILAGAFDTVNGVAMNGIARWDGTTWRTLGPGLMTSSSTDTVRALAVYNGELYAAGAFANGGGVGALNIARWNGTTWSALGAGVDRFGAASLGVFNNELFVGGSFNTAGGLASACLARWNGSAWLAAPKPSAGSNDTVTTFAVANGQLYAGGTFGIDATSNMLLRWTGTTWVSVGQQFSAGVNALAEYQGGLIIGGAFTGLTSLDASRVARLDTLGIATLGRGLNKPVRAILTEPNDLIVGGDFTTVDGHAARRVARWDGSAWSNLGQGLGASGGVYALAAYHGQIYAGGTFQDVNNNAQPKVLARLNGATWADVGTGFFAGAGQAVYALGVFNDRLYAGGSFGSLPPVAGGQGLVSWDGTAYQPVGGGVGGTVYSFAELGGSLYVGGNFSTAGGQPATNIARWDGSAWHAVGAGLNNSVFCLFVWNGELYAGGQFSVSGANGLARLSAGTWVPVGPGLGTQGFAFSLGEFNGSLTVIGSFTLGSGVNATSRLALWNGTTLTGFGTGLGAGNLNSAPYPGALGVLAGELYAGSDALTAGGQVSAYLAHWGSLEPCIQTPPSSTSACVGDVAQFTVAATGSPTLQYQWRHAQQPIEGATASTLNLSGLSHADAGEYDCVVTNAFGSATSSPASLDVVCCPDYNQDGNADQDDVRYLVNVVGGGDNPTGRDPDFNEDGNVDQTDIADLINTIGGGPCP